MTPDDEMLDLGFAFADLGDSWGWKARFWVEDSPHGWPTKEEALQALKDHLRRDGRLDGDQAA